MKIAFFDSILNILFSVGKILLNFLTSLKLLVKDNAKFLIFNFLAISIPLKSFSVRMDPLKVEIDTTSQVFELDPYDYLGQHYSSATTASGKLEISLKSYFQSILMTDSIKNVGFKLYSNMSNDLFDSLSFDLDNVNNRLEIFYVAP